MFGVMRRAEGAEKFFKEDILGQKHGQIYNDLLHFVSPFHDPFSQSDGPWCSCLHWKTRKKLCVHLKKFFAENPDLAQEKETNKTTPLQEKTLSLRAHA